MSSFINEHQLKQIVSYIAKEFPTFIADGKELIPAEEAHFHLKVPVTKTAVSFKSLLWPDGNQGESPFDKMAFLGLTSCDANALTLFLNQFSHTDLLPKREDIVIVSAECTPDDFCFCTAFKKNDDQDLHIQKEKEGYSIFAGSALGQRILRENGVRQALKKPKRREIMLDNIAQLDTDSIIASVSDFDKHKIFWQKIANNCFGCGSCSVVCPLCFCTHQEQKNSMDGKNKRQFCWDSCFSKNFSEIQNHLDERPKRINRLYNWYNHKFVRAARNDKDFLCTGCGRCIKACPAHLNQHKIIENLLRQEGDHIE